MISVVLDPEEIAENQKNKTPQINTEDVDQEIYEEEITAVRNLVKDRPDAELKKVK